jgi:signal transduction histidine kinase
VTDAPATTGLRPADIASWTARWGYCVGYLLLQAATILACILVLRLPLPEPPAGYLLTDAVLETGGSRQPVRLPYLLTSDPEPAAPHDFALSFDRPASEWDTAWSVMVPRFIRGIEIVVNGTVILDSRRNPAASRPDRNIPEIAVIPATLLHDGPNALTIRLYAVGPLTGFLDQVYVGPDQALRPAYDSRMLLFGTLPVVFSAWQAILTVLLGVMWLKRRHEPSYGVLAIAMALGVVQAFVPPAVVVQQSGFARLNAVLISSAPLEAACVLVFVIAFLGLKFPRWGWAIFAPGFLVAIIGLFGGPAMVRSTFMLLVPPTVFVSLLAICAIVGWAAVTRRDGVAALFGCAATVLIAFGINDMLSALDIVVDRRIHVARMSYSVMLAAIGIGLTWRFAKALNEVDSFAGRMVALVRETEHKLRASLALEEERARAATLATERNRLMRDLHDGLGGQLVSIVALSERGAEGGRIGAAARAALKDLRLVIDAMDDIDGDLMLALGAWRERTATQLRSHGLPLEWHVLTPQGMPVHPELRPWHVIQILRLLDEAVTNAVKHSGANKITVTIETIGDTAENRRGRITVEDDGSGFAMCDFVQPGAGAPKPGRGVPNMHKRAARCGATLAVTSGPGGTTIRLDLPREFPSVELSGG